MDKETRAMLLAGAAALTIRAGTALLGSDGAAAPPPVRTATVTYAQYPTITLPPEPALIASEAPVKLALEPERNEIKLLDAALDAQTQQAIYEVCGQDRDLFCFVMAIANRESRFEADAVGDGGRCIGMMQINTRWHTDRMEALGVTDLTDPVQCAAVAVDYLRELESRYGFEPLSHELLMSYNLGPGGARKALNRGMTSTAYSREVMTTYQEYLAELEAAK